MARTASPTAASKTRKRKIDSVVRNEEAEILQVKQDITENQLPVLVEGRSSGESRYDLPPEMKERAVAISQTVSIHDTTSIAEFAVAPQREMSRHLDSLLDKVKTHEAGRAGSLVAELSTGIKGISFDAMKSEVSGTFAGRMRRIAGKLPVVGRFVSHVQKLHAMNDGIQSHLKNIEVRASTYMVQLKNNNKAMDGLLEATQQNLTELAVWIHAGELVLENMREEFEHMKTEVISKQDQVKLVMLRDMAEQINAFDTTLVRLNIAFNQGLKNLPEIRMSQQASQIEMRNTLDTILTDIPSIKSAILRIMNLEQINAASEAAAARRQLNRDLGRIGNNMMRTAYLRAKETQGDFSKDIEYLAEVYKSQHELGLMGAEIDRKAQKTRNDAIGKLREMRESFARSQKEQALISVSTE